MTDPRESGTDPQFIASLSGQFTALGEQLAHIATTLDGLQAQLARIQPASMPAYQQVPYPQQAPYPQPPYPQPGYKYPQAAPPVVQHVARAPQPPQPPRQPWWQRDGMISRVLAVSGAGVTLVGVVLLLVLAAESGWFGPVLRVALGAVFSAALVAVGARVFGRPGGRIGGIAVTATGIAGLYLDVLAVTTVYGWLAPAIGLAVAFGIAACAVTLAVSWNSQPFASLILGGVAVLAPIVTDGISLLLIAFFLAMYLAGFSAQLGRNWPVLHVVRTLPVVVALLSATSSVSASEEAFSNAVWILVTSVVVALFGLGSSIMLLRRSPSDNTAIVMIAAAALPLVLTGEVFDRWTIAAVQLVTAGIFAASIAVFRTIPMRAKSVIAAVAVLALFRVCLESTSSDARTIVLLVVALAFIAASSRGPTDANGSPQLFFSGLAFAIVGGIRFFALTPPEALTDSAYVGRTASTFICAVLFIAVLSVAVLQATERGFTGREVEAVWIVSGLMALYAIMAGTVTLGSVIGGDTGFFAGQCITSIEWMSLATGLLILGLRSEKHAHTALLAGLSLTAASIAKLFLFDLEAQNGLFRVSAFIVVGLLLLIAGTRYAKVFAEREAVEGSTLDSPEQVTH